MGEGEWYMLIADNWTDYELIDAGNGEKLERWGEFILRRPDPVAIWPIANHTKKWDNVHAHYHRSKNGGGNWEYLKKMPEKWTVNYKELSFNIKLMGFKHTGIFPEQAVNWDWMIGKIKEEKRELNVLNLFGYTGGATVAAAYGGAKVCHVDAAKGMVEVAKQNLKASGLENRPARFIVDDVVKFVQREARRGNKYDGIIMDPPVYGHGPNGEVWSIEKDLYNLVRMCMDILSDNPVFFLISCYTGGISPTALGNVLSMSVGSKYGGTVSSSEIGLKTSTKLVLPCGISGRWEA